MMESERGGDDDDLGDGDPERLTRSLECRLPAGGLTNFEKKPGAICLSQPSTVSRRQLFIIKSSVFSANSL
jgi:hypothetical protein